MVDNQQMRTKVNHKFDFSEIEILVEDRCDSWQDVDFLTIKKDPRRWGSLKKIW